MAFSPFSKSISINKINQIRIIKFFRKRLYKFIQIF